MQCPHCGERFPVNLALSCGPGGQEAPGTFLVITGILIVLSLVLVALGIRYWPWFSGGLAGFVGLQTGVAYIDCRRAQCPKCHTPARVKPWAF